MIDWFFDGSRWNTGDGMHSNRIESIHLPIHTCCVGCHTQRVMVHVLYMNAHLSRWVLEDRLYRWLSKRQRRRSSRVRWSRGSSAVGSKEGSCHTLPQRVLCVTKEQYDKKEHHNRLFMPTRLPWGTACTSTHLTIINLQCLSGSYMWLSAPCGISWALDLSVSHGNVSSTPCDRSTWMAGWG